MDDSPEPGLNVRRLRAARRRAARRGPARLLRGRRRRRAHAARERRRLVAPAPAPARARRRQRGHDRDDRARHRVATPVLVAPTALQRMAHPDGEPGMARAAAAAGTIMVALDARDLDRARGRRRPRPGAPRWFQLYVDARPRRVAGAGRRGRRRRLHGDRRDRRRARPRAAASATCAPASASRWSSTMPAVSAAIGRSGGVTVEDFFSLIDPSVTWKRPRAARRRLPAARCSSRASRPARTRRSACEHGAAGVIVSNHGGRQLDSVAATAEMLPEIVDAVDGRARGARRRRHPPRHRRARRARARRARGARRAARRCGASAGGEAGAARAALLRTSGCDCCWATARGRRRGARAARLRAHPADRGLHRA